MKIKCAYITLLLASLFCAPTAFADTTLIKRHLTPVIQHCIDFANTGTLPDRQSFLDKGWKKTGGLGLTGYQINVNPSGKARHFGFLFYKSLKRCDILLLEPFAELQSAGKWVDGAIKKHGFKPQQSSKKGRFTYQRGTDEIRMYGKRKLKLITISIQRIK